VDLSLQGSARYGVLAQKRSSKNSLGLKR